MRRSGVALNRNISTKTQYITQIKDMNKSNIYKYLFLFSIINFLTHVTVHYLLLNEVIGSTQYLCGIALVNILYYPYFILFLSKIKSPEKMLYKHKILPIFLFVLFDYVTKFILNFVTIFEGNTTANDININILKSTVFSFCILLPLSLIISFFVRQKKFTIK